MHEEKRKKNKCNKIYSVKRSLFEFLWEIKIKVLFIKSSDFHGSFITTVPTHSLLTRTYLLGVCGINLSTLVTKVGTFTITSSSSGICMSLIARSSLKYLDHGVYKRKRKREREDTSHLNTKSLNVPFLLYLYLL